MANLSTASLDSFFEPLAGGVQAAATGFKIGAADLNTFYLAKSAGNGATASATNFKIANGNDLNLVFTKLGDATLPLDFTFSPVSPAGSCTYFAGTCNASVAVTANATGGDLTYTYLWEYVSGVVFSIITPTAATATFSKDGNVFNEQGVYRCTVNDGVEPAVVKTITVRLDHINGN